MEESITGQCIEPLHKPVYKFGMKLAINMLDLNLQVNNYLQVKIELIEEISQGASNEYFKFFSFQSIAYCMARASTETWKASAHSVNRSFSEKFIQLRLRQRELEEKILNLFGLFSVCSCIPTGSSRRCNCAPYATFRPRYLV